MAGSTSRIQAGSKSLLSNPGDIEKKLRNKGQMYKGTHEIPVFNYKVSSKPMLLTLNFNVFRVKDNKRKIYVSAKIQKGQPKGAMKYVNANANLMLELTEKAAQKYLLMSDNDFGRMIEDLVIVANSSLKIENVVKNEYKVPQVMDGGYYAYVDDDPEEKKSQN